MRRRRRVELSLVDGTGAPALSEALAAVRRPATRVNVWSSDDLGLLSRVAPRYAWSLGKLSGQTVALVAMYGRSRRMEHEFAAIALVAMDQLRWRTRGGSCAIADESRTRDGMEFYSNRVGNRWVKDLRLRNPFRKITISGATWHAAALDARGSETCHRARRDGRRFDARVSQAERSLWYLLER